MKRWTVLLTAAVLVLGISACGRSGPKEDTANVQNTFLEEPYVPHNLVGVMAQNTQASAKESHVWSAGNQKI